MRINLDESDVSKFLLKHRRKHVSAIAAGKKALEALRLIDAKIKALAV